MERRKVEPRRAEAAVLTAFLTARRAGCPTAECYKAGVEVWKSLHPEQRSDVAARTAVQIMLRAVEDDLLDVDVVTDAAKTRHLVKH